MPDKQTFHYDFTVSGTVSVIAPNKETARRWVGDALANLEPEDGEVASLEIASGHFIAADIRRLIQRDTIPEKMGFEELLEAARAMLNTYIFDENADLDAVDSAIQYIDRALQKHRVQNVPSAQVLGSRKPHV
jgi:hypothetical protein